MKPILIGMNNPVSTTAGHELYPAPDGCTGHRLWKMLNARTEASCQEYLDVFERRNLVRGMVYDKKLATMAAERIYAELWGSGRTVILLGRDVQKAFGHPPVLLHPQLIGGTHWRQIPHPSGRNPWYNEKKNQDLVGVLLEELLMAYRKEIADACH